MGWAVTAPLVRMRCTKAARRVIFVIKPVPARVAGFGFAPDKTRIAVAFLASKLYAEHFCHCRFPSLYAAGVLLDTIFRIVASDRLVTTVPFVLLSMP